MTQNQIVLSDEDDDEERARVALVMRDTPCVPSDDSSGHDTEPQKPIKGIVWAEARVAAPTVHDAEQLPAEVVAVSQVAVIPVEIDNETLTSHTPTDSSTNDDHTNCAAIQGSYTQVETDEEEEMVLMAPAPTTCSLYRWNFIVCVFGNSLLVAAASTTFSFEISASVVYMVGAVFYWVAEAFAKAGDWTVLFQTLFRLLSVLFLSIDLILLTISTLLVELLSWIAGILCILFGGVTVGVSMHQHIRQVCQHIRTVFRKLHANWSPQRMEPYDFQEEEEEADEEAVDTR